MKALIFDMDGVLVDVSNSYRLAIKETVKFFTGTEIQDSEIQELKNKGGFNNDWNLTAALIKAKVKKARKEEVVMKFQKLYLGKNYDGFINNEDWILKKDVLEELKSKFKLGIVTGRPREEAEYALRKAGITAIGVLPPGAEPNLKKTLQDNGAKLVLDNINNIKILLIEDQ